ncbi:MAG: hypothetical protein NZ602_09220 [Thermoguttaceae bacterium]|nr:hypothetical protein [Thermoguttaceae bacterium]MDW8039711.1 hypothetical protein [Thermoguttaceae bacterium]
MDYVRKILTVARKYHFWAVAVLVVVVLGVVWSSASARFYQTYKNREEQIQKDFNNIYQLAGMPDPVNEMVYTAIRSVHEQLQKNVMRGWRYLYEEQKKNNPLPPVLGERFKEEWEKRGPNEELPPDLREHYWNFIERYFPKLLERGGIRRPKNPERLAGWTLGRGLTAPAETGPTTPIGTTEQIEYEGIVVWEDSNYKQFLARFHWNEMPSTQKVRLAQEDLWVYETLLGIIKELNKDATSHYNAVVKRIFALDIGQHATRAFYEARDALGLRSLGGMGLAGVGGAGGMPAELGPMSGPPQPASAPGAAPAPMPEAPPPGTAGPSGIPQTMPPGMLEGPGLPSSPAAGTTELDQLYAYRYVDQNEQPVPVENGVPKHPFSEFKMMPIRMRLLMDQRKIPELLVLCANSKMPIEVRQVRINPGRAAKVNYGTSRTSTAPLMMPSTGPIMEGGAPIGPGGAGIGPSSSGLEGLWTPPISVSAATGLSLGGPGAGETFYQGPYDLVVELLGIIYIYEPPDETKLGTGAALSTPQAGETAPSAPPTLPPAAPPERATPTPPSAPPSPSAGGAGPTATEVPSTSPSAPTPGPPGAAAPPGSERSPAAGPPAPTPPATKPQPNPLPDAHLPPSGPKPAIPPETP